MRKTHEEFLSQIKGRPFIALDTYRAARTKMRFRCSLDGHEWDANPSDIVNNKSGCPVCWEARRGEALRKPNKVLKDCGEYIVVDISSPSYPEATLTIDKTDAPLLEYKVCVGRNGYPSARIGNTRMPIHKILFPTWEITDHINRDKTDARRSNLRECTKSQNNMNKGLQANNTTGVAGLWLDKKRNIWTARIKVNRKYVHLGSFETKELATEARRDAEVRYFGEFRDKGASPVHELDRVATAFLDGKFGGKT